MESRRPWLDAIALVSSLAGVWNFDTLDIGFPSQWYLTPTYTIIQHGDCNSDGSFPGLQNWVSSNVNASANPSKYVGSAASKANQDDSQKEKNIYLRKNQTVTGPFPGGEVKKLALTCPKGYHPMTWDVLPMGDSPEADYTISNNKLKVVVPALDIDGKYESQLTCRKSDSAYEVIAGHHWGSKGNDVISGQEDNKRYLSGPGHDKISVTGHQSHLDAGLGNDKIKIGGKDSVALGGPGNDHITATSNHRIRIEGGPGSDTLIGGEGETHIDARDGTPDDVVICNGQQNIALIDLGDRVEGQCAQVITSNN